MYDLSQMSIGPYEIFHPSPIFQILFLKNLISFYTQVKSLFWDASRISAPLLGLWALLWEPQIPEGSREADPSPIPDHLYYESFGRLLVGRHPKKMQLR
jgi:hypothetical protein